MWPDPMHRRVTNLLVTCMVGKVEAPEKANMMDPKAVKKIVMNPKFISMQTCFRRNNTLEISSPILSERNP